MLQALRIFKAYFILAVALISGACKNYYSKEKQSFSHYDLKQKSPQGRSDSLISGYRSGLEKEMSVFLASATAALTREGSQSALGNFVCDAIEHASKTAFDIPTADIILINRGGLRTNLPAGPITVSHIFELMPFENQLVLLKISGKKLKSGLKNILEKRHPFKGLELAVKKDSLLKSLVNGQAISGEKDYILITSDFIANGGDQFGFLANPLERKDSDVKVRDAIIEYCKMLHSNNKSIVPYTDGRLVEIK